MSLGFEHVGRVTNGFRLLGGIDIDETALATYAHNFNVPTHRADIRDIATKDGTYSRVVSNMLETNPELPTVLVGCAPCQGFSGHRKGRLGNPDERNELIVAFAEIVARLYPEYVVMENVPEMLSDRYREYYSSFKRILQDRGYMIRDAVLNAAEFGVPQERLRAIVVASRSNSFAMPSSDLNPTQFVTVRDAIGDLPIVSPGELVDADPMHRSASHRNSTVKVIQSVPKNGGNRPAGIGPKCLEKIDGYYDVYGRLFWDKPSITITSYARNPASGRFVHPEQDRGLTKREAARLQSFPDGFHFSGSFDEIFRQIGEAVPPRLSTAIAAALLESVRNECIDG